MSHQNFQATIPAPLQSLLGLELMTEAERSEYLASIEALVVDAAVLRYVPTLSVEDQSVFASWLQAHSGRPGLWSQLADTFPAFEVILHEEVDRFLRLDPSQVRNTNTTIVEL